MEETNDRNTFAQYYQHVGRVLENPERFKVKADIGAKAYAYLSKVEKLEDYAKALAAGGLATGAGVAAWWASLGVFGKVMFGIGIFGAPVFLWTAVGVSAAAITLAALKYRGNQEDEYYHRIPKFISCPLDLLASVIAEIYLPPCVVIFGENERILDHMVKEWGYDRQYVEALRRAILANPRQFTISSRAEVLAQKMPKPGHVECSLIVRDMLNVCEAAGDVTDQRLQKLYEVFVDLLQHRKGASLYALRQTESLVRGFEIPETQEVPGLGFGARLRLVAARITGRTRALISRN